MTTSINDIHSPLMSGIEQLLSHCFSLLFTHHLEDVEVGDGAFYDDVGGVVVLGEWDIGRWVGFEGVEGCGEGLVLEIRADGGEVDLLFVR